MVELDPHSGARHGAVLRTLATYRRSRARIDFGVFCEVVACGDAAELHPLGSARHVYVVEGARVTHTLKIEQSEAHVTT